MLVLISATNLGLLRGELGHAPGAYSGKDTDLAAATVPAMVQ